MKKALVLAGGIPQIKLIQNLQNRNYEVVLADYTPVPIAAKFADKFYNTSTLDVDAIREIAIKENVCLIITVCTDQALNTVALLAEELGLPCYISAQTGFDVTNKSSMKGIFAKNNIPTSKFIITNKVLDKSPNINYPIIVKPVDCNSSKGVNKVFNLQQLNNSIIDAINYSRTKTAIIEEYIEGNEISVDAFIENGQAKLLCASYSDKIKDNSKFVINRGRYPLNNKNIETKKIIEIIQSIANAFCLKNSPMLVQMIQKNNELYVLEFSARTGGCIKYHMIELASGFDVINATIDLFENLPTKVETIESNKIIINDFLYCKSGIFVQYDGFDKCKKEGLIEEYFLLKAKGTKLGNINSSGDRIAAITFQTDTYEEYLIKRQKVNKLIKILDNQGNDILRHDLFDNKPRKI